MSNDIYLIGEVGYDITLQNVIEKAKTTDQSKPLNVHIHSEGGGVYEGVAIYNYLKELPQEVNTTAVGLVASIASVIFLAGKNRTAYSQNRILIHNPWNMAGGNAEDFEAVAKDLREEEQKLADIYVSETNFTREEALSQMQEDKMFTTQQLLEKGFITDLKEFKAVAKLDSKMNKEELSKEELSGINKLVNFLGFGKTETKEELKASVGAEPKNIIVKTADQMDVDFTDREEGTPEVGDKATVDGSPATGEHVMANGDTYTFEAGVLTEIVEAEEDAPEEDTMDAELTALKEENEALKTQLANKVEKSELQAKEDELISLQEEHKTLVNKLESFGSTISIDTKIVDTKPTNTKQSFKELLESKN